MAITMRESVDQRDTVDFEVSFEDETHAAVIPTSADWTLTDDGGTIINSRHAVAIAVPAVTVHITIGGDDTDLLSSTGSLIRLLYVRWIYNSSLGSGKEGHKEIKFRIVPIKHLAP
jgi:hypothetical protein